MQSETCRNKVDVDIDSEILREEEALEGARSSRMKGSSLISDPLGLEQGVMTMRAPVSVHSDVREPWIVRCQQPLKGELPKEDKKKIAQQTISCIKAGSEDVDSF